MSNFRGDTTFYFTQTGQLLLRNIYFYERHLCIRLKINNGKCISVSDQ